MIDKPTNGAAEGSVNTLLRMEGLALLVGTATLYWKVGGDWKQFVILFLAPDLSFAGYLFGSRAGTAAYNMVHSTTPPLALAFAGVLLNTPLAMMLALIWLAHIGFDRALGFGLKYDRGFDFTHLGHGDRATKES